MKRAMSGLLGALMLSGALLTVVTTPRPAQAEIFRRTNHHRYYYKGHYYGSRSYRNGRYYYSNLLRDADRDGVRNSHDRDIDGDGRRNNRDHDKDGDGIRNKRDKHPKNPRRR